MSSAPEGVSASEAAELRRELAELRASHDELREASTAREREQARERIEDAEDDLGEIARRTGISRAHLERAMSEARKAERKEELRPILTELLAEKEAAGAAEPPVEGDPPSETDEDGTEAEEEPEPAPKPEPKQRKPKPDSEPVQPHWSDKPLAQVFKR